MGRNTFATVKNGGGVRRTVTCPCGQSFRGTPGRMSTALALHGRHCVYMYTPPPTADVSCTLPPQTRKLGDTTNGWTPIQHWVDLGEPPLADGAAEVAEDWYEDTRGAVAVGGDQLPAPPVVVEAEDEPCDWTDGVGASGGGPKKGRKSKGNKSKGRKKRGCK